MGWRLEGNPGGNPIPIRILTTTQLNTSDPKAIHRLAQFSNADVMIFLAEEPAFRAKGWLFRYLGTRRSVAFVGSSNMSTFALRNGIEWNTRTTVDQIIMDFQSNFDDYWEELSQAFHGKLVLL